MGFKVVYNERVVWREAGVLINGRRYPPTLFKGFYLIRGGVTYLKYPATVH
jgi:hypothetical protein